MPTPEELELRDRRRAWWLRVARRGMNQAGVAQAIGLSAKSGSTIGDWERGVAQPSLRQLEQLASLYGVPLDLFVNPPRTDDERLDEIVRLATSAEQRDWATGQGTGPAADDEPGDAPGRRSA